MSVQDEEREILELWESILKNPDVRKSLVYLWEHRKELRKMEERVQTLESHVLEILRHLPTLRKHSYKEFRAMCERLVSHLDNIEPSKEWVRKIQEDLDFLVKEADMALARGTEMIFARKQAVVEPMLRIVKLASEFCRSFNINSQSIKQGLKSRGLEVLENDQLYKNLFGVLDILIGDGHIPIDAEEAQSVMVRLCNPPHSDFRRFVVSWLMRVVPIFQLVIEALPREAGLIDVQKADSVSDVFHDNVKELYASIDVRYYTLRLYRDALNSEVAVAMMKTQGGAYPFLYSDAIATAFPHINHGVIIRVNRPSRRLINPTKDVGMEEWDGVFQFVQIPTRIPK